ncbi:hypothetical protein ACPFP2_11910 [Micromonospora citrea]
MRDPTGGEAGARAYRLGVDDPDGTWREQRQRAVRAHAAAADARRAAEHAEAAELVAAFVAEATRRGLRPARLTALGYDGRSRYRTRLRGWYLDRARTRAVGVDGRFYLLTVPSSLRARLLGAEPSPSAAPLVVGEGGRDGESIPLRALLNRRLADGDDGR